MRNEQVTSTKGAGTVGQASLLGGVRAAVTGGSSGLGLAMARALAEAGADVAVLARPGSRLAVAGEDVARRAGDAGGMALTVPVDVRDPVSVEEAVGVIHQSWGRLDLLVNNAGIGMRTVNPRFLDRPQPFYEVSPEGFGDVVATNLTGYFLMARAVVVDMVAAGRGRVVNVTVNYETMTRKGFVPYGPSRAGAEALSRIMTEDLRSTGVAVHQLLPGGATATGMIPENVSPEVADRLLSPEIMGPPIVFLASPQAEGLTGLRIVASEWPQWWERFRESGETAP